jgi:hypothetical protein
MVTRLQDRQSGFKTLWQPEMFLFSMDPPNLLFSMMALSLGIKWPVHDTDHSPPSTVKVMNE